jgi:SHS2 domain-containing protein
VPFRWVEHTGEVELELEAESEEEVFLEGLLALADLLADDPRGEPRSRRVSLEARDHATLLAEWLGELVYLSETDGFLPEEASDLALEGNRLTATIEGRSATPRNLVKAITLHRLALEQEDGRWRGRVILDV